MNPAPDADINSVGEDNFHWIVDAVAELAVRKAKEHTGEVKEYRWGAFLYPGQAGSAPKSSQISKERYQGVIQMKRPSLSIGIEEEYQTIDPVTRDLRSHIETEMLPKASCLAERVKAEMHTPSSKLAPDLPEHR